MLIEGSTNGKDRVPIKVGADGTLAGSGGGGGGGAAGGVIDANNSTVALLGSNGVWTGAWTDVTAMAAIQIFVNTTVASAANGLAIQFSPDGGTTSYTTDNFTPSTVNPNVYSFQPAASHFRLVYTNGISAQTAFVVQTILHSSIILASSQRPMDAMTNENDYEMVLSTLMGYNGATWDRLRASIANGLAVDVTRLVPGVGATSLGKAEDAVHATGDTGVATFGVRVPAVPAAQTSAAGDYGVLAITADGKQIAAGTGAEEHTWSGGVTITNSVTSTAVKAAAAAGVRNYVTDLIISNQHSAAVTIQFFDGATALTQPILLPLGSTSIIGFNTPLRGTAATAINAVLGTAVAGAVNITASGYIGV